MTDEDTPSINGVNIRGATGAPGATGPRGASGSISLPVYVGLPAGKFYFDLPITASQVKTNRNSILSAIDSFRSSVSIDTF